MRNVSHAPIAESQAVQTIEDTPLAITGMNVEIVKRACEYNFPVGSTVCPSAGTTSPYTLAGTLVTGNAENLFIAAFCQLIKPGHPFAYALGPAVTNMRSSVVMYYTLDRVLWKAAHVQLGKSLTSRCPNHP